MRKFIPILIIALFCYFVNGCAPGQVKKYTGTHPSKVKPHKDKKNNLGIIDGF